MDTVGDAICVSQRHLQYQVDLLTRVIGNLTNDVPQAFDWDTTTQKSVDRWQRPELNYSVVEFVAPQEYMVRPPQPLVYLFVFDVSYAAVINGLLATSARCIMESLDRIPNADRCVLNSASPLLEVY